jgi:tetratricopeptide (TPR) repeat protein
MREENVARARAFTDWLAGGREDAFRAKAEILEQPPAEWDAWLAAHPEAATMHTLQALLKAASGDPRAFAITRFVLRYAGEIALPVDAEPLRTILRERALRELSRQFQACVHQNLLEALTVSQLAVAAADASVSKTLAAYAWRDHAVALRLLARYEEAFAAHDRAERTLPPGERYDLPRANIVFARVGTLQDAGRLEEAMPLIRQCRRAFERYGDRRGQLFAEIGEAGLLHRTGRYGEACALGRSLLATAEELGDLNTLASIHNLIGHAAIELGDLALAESHLAEAVRLSTETGQPLQVARAEMGRGRLLIREGRIDEGIERLHRVREELFRHSLVEEAGLCGLDVVEAHLERGAPVQAEAFARQIVREFTAARLNARAITALGYLGEAIAARKASQTTVRDVGRFIRALRANPELEFVA